MWRKRNIIVTKMQKEFRRHKNDCTFVVNRLLGQLTSIVVPNVDFFGEKNSGVILWHTIDGLGKENNFLSLYCNFSPYWIYPKNVIYNLMCVLIGWKSCQNTMITLNDVLSILMKDTVDIYSSKRLIKSS